MWSGHAKHSDADKTPVHRDQFMNKNLNLDVIRLSRMPQSICRMFSKILIHSKWILNYFVV